MKDWGHPRRHLLVDRIRPAALTGRRSALEEDPQGARRGRPLFRRLQGWLLCGLIAASLGLPGTGCRSAAREQRIRKEAVIAARIAQQAEFTRRLQERKLVWVQGPVNHPEVPWKQGLTLARAILDADYHQYQPPGAIVILRQGVSIPVDPDQLLHGKDMPLQPGDIVQLMP